MVYLITGGAGFVGSHLAERLLERGDEVLLMDNLSTGSMENIRHLKKYDRMHYFLEPLENRQLLAELVDEADVIFHLAAAVGVKLIVESPVRTIETNVNGTQMVLAEFQVGDEAYTLNKAAAELARKYGHVALAERLARAGARKGE